MGGAQTSLACHKVSVNTASLKGQINKFLCTQEICVEKVYVKFPYHISL